MKGKNFKNFKNSNSGKGGSTVGLQLERCIFIIVIINPYYAKESVDALCKYDQPLSYQFFVISKRRLI